MANAKPNRMAVKPAPPRVAVSEAGDKPAPKAKGYKDVKLDNGDVIRTYLFTD
jgi:hypothetical protein